jgi:hypothetical protein
MKPGCIGKSNKNNLPAPTDLTENPYGIKTLFFFKDATQKSARVVVGGIAIELHPREPIFEKCPHLRGKGGVLTLRTPHGVCAYPYSICIKNGIYTGTTGTGTVDHSVVPNIYIGNPY